MEKILFVCLGNICRSPAAQAIFETYIKNNHATDKFKVDSAGTSGYHSGDRADPRMRQFGQKRGHELTSISRKFDFSDFYDFDYIICMDESNYQDVLSQASEKEHRDKVSKMMSYSKSYQQYLDVPDPYYGGDKGFELVYDLLEDACLQLFNKLNS